jgi:hypothetical protein
MTPEGALAISVEEPAALAAKFEVKIAENLVTGAPVEDLSGRSLIEAMVISQRDARGRPVGRAMSVRCT